MTIPNSQSSLKKDSRREFIVKTGTFAAGALLTTNEIDASLTTVAESPPKAPKGLVGSQLYGWGQYYQRMEKNWSDHIDEIFSALRDAGYDYAEGFVDVNNPENMIGFADRLRSKGLAPVSLYTGGQLHEKGKSDEVVEKLIQAGSVCRQAGFKIINCNPDPIGREKSEEELKVQANALTKLGEGLKQHQIQLGIHNHTPALINHAREFHHNFRETSPALVGFCFDVHWVYRGGVKPMEALREYSNRIVSWHLRQSRNRIWWEDLDSGDIDYRQIAKFSSAHQIAPLYTVELAIEKGTKITRSVVENHRRSREFIRKIFQA